VTEARRPQTTRGRRSFADEVRLACLAALTLVVAWTLWKIAQPFLGPLVWAGVLALVAARPHRWIEARVRRPGLAAGLTTALVTILILLPMVFVGTSLVRAATEAAAKVRQQIEEGHWRSYVESKPLLRRAVEIAEKQVKEGGGSGGASGGPGGVPRVLSGTFRAAMELLITVFALFYFVRDGKDVRRLIRSLLPMANREADRLITRVSDTVYATTWGTVVVAAVQGLLGGLMFWWLGLPAPLLWGTVMALLAIIPVLGAFVVWVPAAVFLALDGSWGKAIILALWGGVVVALVDNLLYPVLVGNRMRLHTLAVFIAIVGGLSLFGAYGLVLGPAALAAAVELLRIWRRRMRTPDSAQPITA
jgi:predicted PurR-regulated permease PerM